jgi:hypothetical protein
MTNGIRIHSLAVLFTLVCLTGCGSGDSDPKTDPEDASFELDDMPKGGLGDDAAGSKKDADKHAKHKQKQKKHKYPANHLAGETSPYLLMHAHNPVDWYPWGPEAFEKAKKENKPIFLSVGYSSCYWCHVMERLVFVNEKIAKQLNEKFVCVKVDREERPDVDDIYMTALQVYIIRAGIGGGGGWPLSMFLTPEGKPFAGGTYFPPEDEGGRPGFSGVLDRIATMWSEKPKEIEEQAEILTSAVQQTMKPQLTLKPAKYDRESVKAVTQAVLATYDGVHGGVGYHPENRNPSKFPIGAKLSLLQYEARRHGNEEAEKAVLHTLDRIAAGGIHDHLGGGFHRYSTDRRWHVPHFEKMLYDQAQLAEVYVEAYRQTNEPRYKAAVEGIVSFVFSEMTDTLGGFHSALDAESNTIEGESYVWTVKEVDSILGAEDGPLFRDVYGMDEARVFEHGYVLHLPRPIAEVATERKIDPATLGMRLDAMRKKLLAVRNKRDLPLKDDKILTSWNGLMIAALADAGKTFERDDYLQAADKAATFVLGRMRDEDGRLLRTYRGGVAKLNAYLDDYAFIIRGTLSLHLATGDEKWLNASRRLMDQQIEMFWNETSGGFYFTSHHHETLIARTRNVYDSALPAGNAVSIRNLVRLASLTDDEKYSDYAEKTIIAFAPQIERSPGGVTTLALAISEFLDKPDFAAPKRKSEDSGAGFLRGGTGILPVKGESSTNAKAKPKNPAIATARSYLSVDRLPAGGVCRIVMIVDIKDGWHINANPASPNSSVPTTFSLKSKYGTKLVRIRYPASKKLTVEGFDAPILIYEKRAVIYGEFEIPAAAAGKTEELELTVRYLPCNDNRCLRPTTATLTGKITIAAPGAAVKRINDNLFPPAR